MSSRVLGTLSTLCTSQVMELILDKLVPFLSNVDEIGAREGAIETIYCILEQHYFSLHVIKLKI